MGEVWRAEHATLLAPVAIKLIDPELLDRVVGTDLREVLARFQREAQAAAALRSPHVVQILDHGVEGDCAYMAMELLEGETLAQRIKRIGTLPHVQTARIITHIARAVTKAHEAGIVHRDLKPENVFIVKNDDEEVAKVLDFGIAKLTRDPLGKGGLTTHTGHIVGTPCYMSPEQAQGTKTIDWRTDLWAMAVIAYECVCGQRPFQSEAVGDLVLQICARTLPVPSEVATVPEGFDAWWAKATNRDPELRFQSAKTLAEWLRAVLVHDGSQDTNPTLPPLKGPLLSTTRGVSTSGPSDRSSAPAISPASQPDASEAPERTQRSAATRALLAGGIVAAAAGALALAWPATPSPVPTPTHVAAQGSAPARPADSAAAPAGPETAAASAEPPRPMAVASASARPAATTATPASAGSAKGPRRTPTKSASATGRHPDRLGF